MFVVVVINYSYDILRNIPQITHEDARLAGLTLHVGLKGDNYSVSFLVIWYTTSIVSA
jgi:hypothetical protein